jgi:hypothetical protein
MSKRIPRWIYLFALLSLAGFFALISMLQLLSFPGQFAFEARTGHGTQLARWILTFIVGIWFIFAQVSLIALGKIISFIYQDQLLSLRGKKWINVLTRALIGGTIYGGGVTLFAAIQADDPGPVVVVATITAFTATISVIGYFFRYQVLKSSGERNN